MTNVGMAKNHLGSHAQAVAWCRRAIETNRNYPSPNFQLGVALARLGRLDEAASRSTRPYSISPRARAAWTAMSGSPMHLAQLETILEGMHKAGAPEQ